MKESCLCCGVPLERACRYIAAIDIVLGATSCIFISVQVIKAYGKTGDGSCCKTSYFLPQRFDYHVNRSSYDKEPTLPGWLPILILVCSAIQSIMGIVLYYGATIKSRKICREWLLVTGVTCLFTGFLLRIYEMLVVSEFTHELDHEQRTRRITNNCNIINQPITPQQLLPIPLATGNNASTPRNVGNTSTGYNNAINNAVPLYRNQQQSQEPSPFIVPPTPPSYVSIKDKEQPPPPYHIAINYPKVPKY